MTLDEAISNNPGELDMNKIITNLIRSDSAFSNDIKSKFQGILNSISTKLESGKGALKIDLTTLFNVDKQSSQDYKRQFSTLQKTAIVSLNKLIPNIKKLEIEKFNLTSLFPSESISYNKTTTQQFQNVQKTALKSLTKLIPNVKKLEFEKFDLNNIFSSTPDFSFWTRRTYQSMIRSLMRKIKDVTTSVKIYPFSVRELLGETTEMSKFTKAWYQHSIRGIMSNIKKATSKIIPDISIKEFLGDSFKIGTKISLQDQRRLIKDITVALKDKTIKDIKKSKEIDLSSKIDFKNKIELKDQKEVKDTFISKTLNTLKDKISKDKKEDKKSDNRGESVFQNIPEVIVSDFSDTAIKKLAKLFSKKEEQKTPEKTPSKIPTWLLGALLALGALGSLIYGLLTDGPFKGAAKIATRALTWLSKGPFKKLIGTFSKFFDDILKPAGKALMEGFSHLTSFFGKILKPMGKFLGKMFAPMTKMIAPILKGGGNFFKGLIPKVAKFFGVKSLSKIPVLGLLISGAFAYSRFKKGGIDNIIGGIIDLASGIASTVPGIGTVLSIGLDVLNSYLDYKTSGTDGKQKPKKLAILNDLGLKLADKVKNWPLFRNLIKLSEGIGQIAAGDWKKGLYSLAEALPFGPELIKISEWMAEKASKGSAVVESTIGNLGDMASKFGKYISEKLFNWMPGFMKNFFELDKEGHLKFKPFDKIKDFIDDLFGNKKSNDFKKIDVKAAAKSKIDVLKERGLWTQEKEDAILAGEAKRLGRQKMANDFVWRQGQKLPFSPQDNIIGFKGQLSFKEGKDINENVIKLDDTLNEIKQSIINLEKSMMSVLRETGKRTVGSAPLGPIPNSSSGSSISDFRSNVLNTMRG